MSEPLEVVADWPEWLQPGMIVSLRLVSPWLDVKGVVEWINERGLSLEVTHQRDAETDRWHKTGGRRFFFWRIVDIVEEEP